MHLCNITRHKEQDYYNIQMAIHKLCQKLAIDVREKIQHLCPTWNFHSNY